MLLLLPLLLLILELLLLLLLLLLFCCAVAVIVTIVIPITIIVVIIAIDAAFDQTIIPIFVINEYRNHNQMFPNMIVIAAQTDQCVSAFKVPHYAFIINSEWRVAGRGRRSIYSLPGLLWCIPIGSTHSLQFTRNERSSLFYARSYLTQFSESCGFRHFSLEFLVRRRVSS